MVGGVVDDARDAGRAVRVAHHLGAEAEAVVRLAEAGVVGAAEELVDGLRVAVGGEEVAQRIEREAEGVDLAVGEVLDARAVGPEAVDVARVHVDFVAVAAFDARCRWRSRGRRRSSRRSPRTKLLVMPCVSRLSNGPRGPRACRRCRRRRRQSTCRCWGCCRRGARRA